jgi:hypothetical protein
LFCMQIYLLSLGLLSLIMNLIVLEKKQIA